MPTSGGQPAMELSFGNRAIRRRCSAPADDEWSERERRGLERTLADLQAAPHLADMPLPGSADARDPSRIIVPVIDNIVLIGRVNHVGVRQNRDGSTAWQLVDRFRIDGVERREE